MKKRKYIILVGLILQIGKIYAQETITLEQCRTQAIEYNKALKKAGYQQEQAEAYQKVARTAYLPSLSADATLMHRPQEINVEMPGGFLPTAASVADGASGNFSGLSNVYSPGMSMQLDNLTLMMGGLSLTQPVFTGGKIYYANQQANLGVEMASEGYKLKYSEVIENTDKAFWQVAMIEANISIAKAYIKMLAELEEQMTQMYEVGLKPASEKLKVSVQKNEADLNLLKAQNGLKIAKMYLNQVLGRDLNAAVNIRYDTTETPLFDMSNGAALASENRSELKLLQQQVEMSELDKKITRADYLPSAGVSAQYSTFYVNDLYDGWEMSPMISGKLTIPVFSWGQGKQKQKAANFAILQAKEELNRTNDLINLQVMQVRVQVEEAYEAILIAEKNLKEAHESLDETKASFEAGLNTTTEMLNAQADWQKANAQLVSAKAEYKVLETTWKKTTGQLVINE